MKEYTAQDMIQFAEFCGKWAELGYHKKRGTWQIDDKEEITTQQLFYLWEDILIPKLPNLDDLKDIKLGLEKY